MDELNPRQVLCVGRSYADHARELGNAVPEPEKPPLLFWKPPGCRSSDGVVPLPRWAEGPTRIDYEGELALVLGQDLGPGCELPADPWDAVSAIAAAVDVSDRDLQKKEPQWVRAKAFAGALVLGAPQPRPADPARIALETRKNGELVQEGHTRDLLYPCRDLLTYVSGFCRLFPGDVILTGTPAGVGPVQPGDEVTVELRPAEGQPCAVTARFSAGPEVAPFRVRAW